MSPPHSGYRDRPWRLEELLTDETVTAEELHTDEAEGFTTEELLTDETVPLRSCSLTKAVTAEESHTDEAEEPTAEELLTDETATAEELHSDEDDELTTDASQNTVLPPSLRKTQYRHVPRLIFPPLTCPSSPPYVLWVEKRSCDSLPPWTSRLRIHSMSPL